MRRLLLSAVPLCIVALPASAQMVDVPIWGNGILGQQALRNTYDNTNRQMKADASKSRASTACSADALPAADRRRMEIEYMRRARADGKASADAWVREQGRRFHEKLVAQGVCPPPEGSDRTRVASADRGKADVRDKNGKRCTKTRLENRVSPGFGGAPMTMGLVPVCAD